jgi:G3E family GTPase
MPITVISGFLGAGKTTFLQHVIESDASSKFGLVVNDVASVNVDAKQIRQQTTGTGVFAGVDTMELQNGCVCCTLAEDLLVSVSKLVSLSTAKGADYDHIVVECSGIAEPRKIRDLFQEAEDYGSPLLDKIQLDTLVTLVDASVFLDLFGSEAEVKTYRDLVVKQDEEGDSMLEQSGYRKITELILEQVECADIILINKCDLLKDENDLKLVKKVVNSINPNARVLTCTKGQVQDPLQVIGSSGGEGAASWGILDEHRKMIQAVEKANIKECDDKACNDPTHNHDHGHDHAKEAACADPTCNDPTHNHDHGHDHAKAAACADPTCNDPTHNHDHAKAAACADSTCNDPTHNHDHGHDHAKEAACADPTCNDPTHNHDHGHSHATTAEERFGITSFVYKQRRPFHPIRLSLFLKGLGKLSVKGISGLSSSSDDDVKTSNSGKFEAARRSLLRSKGFVWMGTSSAAAYFMSHAGQYLELMVLGRWWDDISRKEWPEGAEPEIMIDFDGKHGDRRQEIVFIGQFGTASTNSKEAFTEVLDSCLLTDEEFALYEKTVPQGDEALRALYFKQ